MEKDLLLQIQKILNEKTSDFNVLEAQIDVEKQVEYFEYVKKLDKNYSPEEILNKSELLFDENSTIEEKKQLLCRLAKLDEVSAYRTIEKYLANADEELKSWGQMAYNESKMTIQSSLLDENQVFISTGLGGKGNKLRYFVVLLSVDKKEFSSLHQNIIKKEIQFALSKNDSELEIIEFIGSYATITCMIPISVSLSDILREAIEECNQIGGFIQSNFIVTNVKKFTVGEIQEFLEKNDNEQNTEFDDDDYDIED